jgi:hypothetical protein
MSHARGYTFAADRMAPINTRKKWLKRHPLNDVPPQRSWCLRSDTLRTLWLVVFIADQLTKTG